MVARDKHCNLSSRDVNDEEEKVLLNCRQIDNAEHDEGVDDVAVNMPSPAKNSSHRKTMFTPAGVRLVKFILVCLCEDIGEMVNFHQRLYF